MSVLLVQSVLLHKQRYMQRVLGVVRPTVCRASVVRKMPIAALVTSTLCNGQAVDMDRPEFSGPVPYDVMQYIYELEEEVAMLEGQIYDRGPLPNWGHDDSD